MATDKADPFLPYALAQEYMSGELWGEAAIQFAACAHDFPDYLPAYYHWALALIKTDDLPTATDVLKRGLTLAQKQKQGKTAAEIEALLEDLD